MIFGKLYGIGIGPGDPELITLKGARLISACRNLFVPKARTASESVALAIARPLVGPGVRIEELLFPMTADREKLAERWDEAAARVAEVLAVGEDACFLTLGDPLLYSTYIYLLRALRRIIPDLKAVTVPGITAFGAAAALTDFPVGEGREPVTIVPAADDLGAVRRALTAGGTVVLMKIGKRLPEVLDLLEGMGLLESGVFVSHATMAEQRIETDLRRLKADGPEAGYLSIVLVHAGESSVKLSPNSDMKAKYEKWVRWINLICKDLEYLCYNKYIFLEVQKIISANADLNHDNAFYDLLDNGYVNIGAMGIRRHVKNDPQSISLVSLLEDILNNPKLVSIENYGSLYYGPIKELAESHFGEFKAQDRDHIDPDMVARDLASLRKTADSCEGFADRRLAHSDKRQVYPHPSFSELDRCIDLIKELAEKYRLILTAENVSLTPSISEDWKAVFRVPWID